MPDDVTQLLHQWSAGDAEALDRLVPVVYDELRGLARARLRHERSDHTLGTAGLVHEAYARLIDIERVTWKDRGHFFAMASRAMRRVLVDWARAQGRQKRGGGAPHVTFDDALQADEDRAGVTLDLDDALRQLEGVAERAAQVAEMRYFGGLTNDEAAAALNVSVATVERDLRFARAWLAREWGA